MINLLLKSLYLLRPIDAEAQPFLTLVDGQYQEALPGILPLGPINRAAVTAAAVIGKPLYPFRLFDISPIVLRALCPLYCTFTGDVIFIAF